MLLPKSLFVALVGILMVPTYTVAPACAEASGGVSIVIRYPNGTEESHCAPWEEGLDGLEVLRSAGLDISTKDFGGLGAAVCKINGSGNEIQDCPGTNGHWHYWRWSEGSWIESAIGPSSYEVTSDSFQGWTWSTRDQNTSPRATSASGICLKTTQSNDSGRPVKKGATSGVAIFSVLGVLVLAAGLAGTTGRR